ncbi:hypothetical protein [Amycolatopsis sp. FDAARGOS 1241]|uniref:hypothetical protein n=1 Tax=Amycolatopsis sp. FDAARGOS 1241 TaxID=2778070 RepID=UPI001EF2686C|nr:hypothetical protein [Amycolatopsis sp. FDAARGOS 1241]
MSWLRYGHRSLYDAALAVPRRRVLGVPVHCVERNFAELYQPHAAVEEAWTQVYRSQREYRNLPARTESLCGLNHQY